MPDVAIKIFSNRQSYNGGATVTVDKMGGSGVGGQPAINTIHPYLSSSANAPNPSGLAAYLDRRFDDPTYYTA